MTRLCPSIARGQPRLVYQPHFYQRVIDLKPSRANTLEFCLGSLAEMTDGDIYETVEQYSRQNKLAYDAFPKRDRQSSVLPRNIH